MARFDVFPNPGNPDVPFLLDVQCNLLQSLNTSVVVPLRTMKGFASVALPQNLAPTFEINGMPCFMETPALAAVPNRILVKPVASLAAHHADITAALDFLFQGF